MQIIILNFGENQFCFLLLLLFFVNFLTKTPSKTNSTKVELTKKYIRNIIKKKS